MRESVRETLYQWLEEVGVEDGAWIFMLSRKPGKNMKIRMASGRKEEEGVDTLHHLSTAADVIS